MISNPSYRGHVVTPPAIIPDQWSLNANITSVLFWSFIEVPHISVHGERSKRSTSLGIKVGPQTPKTLLNTLSGGQRGGVGLWSTLLFYKYHSSNLTAGQHFRRLIQRYGHGPLFNGSYPSHALWLNHHDLRFQPLRHTLSQAFLLVHALVTAKPPARTNPHPLPFSLQTFPNQTGSMKIHNRCVPKRKEGPKEKKRDSMLHYAMERGRRWADSGTLCERAWGMAGRRGAGVALGTGRSWWAVGATARRTGLLAALCFSPPALYLSRGRSGSAFGAEVRLHLRASTEWAPLPWLQGNVSKHNLSEVLQKMTWETDGKSLGLQYVIWEQELIRDHLVSFVFIENYDNFMSSKLFGCSKIISTITAVHKHSLFVTLCISIH